MTTNGHARHNGSAAPSESRPGTATPGHGAPEYLVIVHPAGDLDAPHLARYWTEVPALSACTADGPTVDQAVENTRHAITRWLESRALSGPAGPFRLAVELAF
jgi:predicted RNase H-like HicB family nuclease